MKLCIWDHEPPSNYSGPRGIGGWTIAAPFFEDVENANTLDVDKQSDEYADMKAVRDNYENYYADKIALIETITAELSEEQTAMGVMLRLSSIHTYIANIDSAYFAAAQDMQNLMDEYDEDLYDDYETYLLTL